MRSREAYPTTMIINNGENVRIGHQGGDIHGPVYINMGGEGMPEVNVPDDDGDMADDSEFIPFQGVAYDKDGTAKHYGNPAETGEAEDGSFSAESPQEYDESRHEEDTLPEEAEMAETATEADDAEMIRQRHLEDEARKQRLKEIRDELHAAFLSQEEAPETPETAEITEATQARALELRGQIPSSRVQINTLGSAPAPEMTPVARPGYIAHSEPPVARQDTSGPFPENGRRKPRRKILRSLLRRLRRSK